jgi:signal transduction histidine kinase
MCHDLGEMRDLITELLESERLANGHAALHTEAVDLPALVRELVAAQWPDAGLNLQLDERIGAVRVDPMRVRLLLRNLIDNALRHSAGAPQAPVVSLSSDAEGQLHLRVRDFGLGVAEEHLPYLTEPFYRADSARQRATGGYGLGLYLCPTSTSVTTEKLFKTAGQFFRTSWATDARTKAKIVKRSGLSR